MFRITFVSLSLVMLPAAAVAQPSAAGDVMFVGFNADTPDGFAIVTLVDIPDTTVIHFSENEWTGAVLNSGEGNATWTNDTGGVIGEGTVLTFTSMETAPAVSQGAVSGDNMNFNTTNEIIYAYLGTATVPTTFLAGYASDDFDQNGATLTGTGLTAGTDAVQGDTLGISDDDVAVYIGDNHCDGLTQLQCQQQIANVAANWDSEDGSGDQAQNSTPPDFPDDVIGDFTTVPVELQSFSID